MSNELIKLVVINNKTLQGYTVFCLQFTDITQQDGALPFLSCIYTVARIRLVSCT